MPNPRAAAPVKPLRLPSYRLHKASERAVVTLASRDHYLGEYGSAESKEAYQQRMAEWLAGGAAARPKPVDAASMTISELILAYWQHLKAIYPEQTREGMIAPVLRRLRKLYGPTTVAEFGPLALKAFRHALLEERSERGKRLSRPYINRCVQWVKRMFRWAVGEELIGPMVLHALQAVEPLRMGRSDAPEPPPVVSVPDAHVEAVLPHLPPIIADMVMIQRLTGMRPGELCAMTTGELDTTGTVWMYRPMRVGGSAGRNPRGRDPSFEGVSVRWPGAAQQQAGLSFRYVPNSHSKAPFMKGRRVAIPPARCAASRQCPDRVLPDSPPTGPQGRSTGRSIPCAEAVSSSPCRPAPVQKDPSVPVPRSPAQPQSEQSINHRVELEAGRRLLHQFGHIAPGEEPALALFIPGVEAEPIDPRPACREELHGGHHDVVAPVRAAPGCTTGPPGFRCCPVGRIW